MTVPPPPLPTSENLGTHAGVSLKPDHYEQVLEEGNDGQMGEGPKWFEVHMENYMGDGGLPHYYLDRIGKKFPLSFHGVGLSLGSGGGLDRTHLDKIKTLVDRYNPSLVSEHVAWSIADDRQNKIFHNDLLPVPYTHAALDVLVDNINEMQDHIGRKILIENPSTYLTFRNGDFDEADFILEALKRTGAGLLLDVNNVYVSASNHGWDGEAYLNKIPADVIGEVHMAGHHVRDYNGKTIRIDDHGSHVTTDVWGLFEDLIKRVGPKPTLIEWDTDVPTFDVLKTEAALAQIILDAYRKCEDFHLMGARHG